ncbi:MAG TPA: RNA polymerase sigma factor [Polyangiaceae bacterium]|nr:RNA polymerase sigma factor [Polyangiaceae bacterium]
MVRARVVPLQNRAVLRRAEPRTAEALDAELVERVRAADQGAEQTLFNRHAPYILALSFRLLRDSAEAEDVLQETFLDAITQLRGTAAPGRVRQWLAGIAVHKVHRRFRRRKLQAVLGLFRPSDESVLEASAHPDASPEIRAELALLDVALVELPDAERAAWVLKYVEGYGLDDVARLCRCSLATAKRRIARARRVVLVHIELPEVDDA